MSRNGFSEAYAAHSLRLDISGGKWAVRQSAWTKPRTLIKWSNQVEETTSQMQYQTMCFQRATNPAMIWFCAWMANSTRSYNNVGNNTSKPILLCTDKHHWKQFQHRGHIGTTGINRFPGKRGQISRATTFSGGRLPIYTLGQTIF